MVKDQKFDKPIVTPTTKAEYGEHDEPISKEEIINGFKSAFLPHNERRELIRNVVDELEAEFSFEKRVIV